MSDPERPPAPPPFGGAQPEHRDTRPERSGPLTLERHRKADGRSLILYRAATGAPGEGVDTSAAERG